METLDDYSRAALDALLADHPEWTDLVRYAAGGFEIEVQAPSVAAPTLEIWSEPEELSVAFDRWHTHFDDWDGPSLLGLRWDARTLVAKILAEEVAVAVQINGDHWGGSWLVSDPAKAPELDEPLAGNQIVYTRSWAGRWDAEYRPA